MGKAISVIINFDVYPPFSGSQGAYFRRFPKNARVVSDCGIRPCGRTLLRSLNEAIIRAKVAYEEWKAEMCAVVFRRRI